MMKTVKTLKKFLNLGNLQSKEQNISYDQKREVIDKYRKQFNCKTLVETGTFLGDTIWYFRDCFEHLFSIELSHDLAVRAEKRFETHSNVKIIEGNSADILKDLLPTLKQPSLFWLDGHYSSEFFLNGEYFITARGDSNTPIEKELDTIFRTELDHIILIDDARLFTGKNDYPDIADIKAKVKANGKKYNVIIDSDIIQIIPTT
jgi:hypothetical protein